MPDGLRLLIAAGGTGGHLLPALALARAVRARRPDIAVTFVGTGRPIEKEILGPEGFERLILESSGLKGAGLEAKLNALMQAAKATLKARALIKNLRPALCFGVGGYVTGPVGLAAKLCGVPLFIHEANSRAGLSNRLLGKIADLVMLGDAAAAAAFPAKKIVVTGNPVRPEIEALHGLVRNYESGRPLILVTGGSQGAEAINRAAGEAFLILKREGLDFSVVHQCGPNDVEPLSIMYEAAGIEHEVAAFFRDMPELYRRAGLAVSRGGAGTLSELAAAGLPALVVPLPSAADDHQTVNARSLVAKGAARLLPQSALSPESLAAELGALIKAPADLASMSLAAKNCAVLDAAEHMARLCLECIEHKEKHVS